MGKIIALSLLVLSGCHLLTPTQQQYFLLDCKPKLALDDDPGIADAKTKYIIYLIECDELNRK